MNKKEKIKKRKKYNTTKLPKEWLDDETHTIINPINIIGERK